MLQDLREFLDQPVLRMPIGGRIFEVQPVSAREWLRLQEVQQSVLSADPESAVSDASRMTEVELYKLVLGDAYEELLDNVSRPELEKAALTAYYWQLGRNDIAESFWSLGGKAEAPTPARAPRKSTTRTSTGAANTTRKRASTSGTTSRKKP